MTFRKQSVRTVGVAALLVAAMAGSAAAQDVRPVAFGAVGFGNIFRVEDDSFGTKLNLGAGGGIEWKRLAIEGEIHRTSELSPRLITCDAFTVPCTGSAREGVLEATAITANIAYTFGAAPVRPYVIGSVGVLHSDSVNSLTIATSTTRTISEFRERDTGMAIGVGVGIDLALTPHLSIRPEFRTYSSTIMSRANLSMHRGSASLRYRW